MSDTHFLVHVNLPLILSRPGGRFQREVHVFIVFMPSIQTSRRRLPREIREAQICAAALSIFRDYGYEGGSIARIAKKSGLAEGTLYKFYESKKEILEVCICNWYEGVLKEYESDLNHIEKPEQKLRYAISHNIHCLCEDPVISNLYLELRRDQHFKSSLLIEYNKKYIGILRSIIRSLRQGTLGSGISISAITRVIYSCAELGTESHRINNTPLNQDQLTEEILKVTKKLL